MAKYTATARRSGGWWALEARAGRRTVASQVRRLDRAADVMREAIAAVLDVDEAEVEVDVKAEMPARVERHLAKADRLREESRVANAAAAAEVRAAARELSDDGMTLRDIGAVLGVSFQRAVQLVAPVDGQQR